MEIVDGKCNWVRCRRGMLGGGLGGLRCIEWLGMSHAVVALIIYSLFTRGEGQSTLASLRFWLNDTSDDNCKAICYCTSIPSSPYSQSPDRTYYVSESPLLSSSIN
ncbi:hypothetical protein PENSPDRAFT_369950 [Peniophora sp. CONT]|nr:hypothetical protein PENSPDRAFT_369950 [Peniophora sp. CONT]